MHLIKRYLGDHLKASTAHHLPTNLTQSDYEQSLMPSFPLNCALFRSSLLLLLHRKIRQDSAGIFEFFNVVAYSHVFLYKTFKAKTFLHTMY